MPTGRVRGVGHKYADGTEALEIHVPKTDASGLPFEPGRRVPVSVVVGGRTYTAGLRSTEPNDYVWVAPDLSNETGREVKLAHVLGAAGVTKNQAARLDVSGTVVTVSPELE